MVMCLVLSPTVHILMWVSNEPVAMCWLSGDQARHITLAVCAVHVSFISGYKSEKHNMKITQCIWQLNKSGDLLLIAKRVYNLQMQKPSFVNNSSSEQKSFKWGCKNIIKCLYV